MSGDWRFARRPFWLFSHLFAASVVVSFVFLGIWQLDRLDQRRATNAVIAARTAESLDLGEALDRLEVGDPAGLDYQAVVGSVRMVDADFARIANRSRNGVAGEHVVAIVELDDGSVVAANRGFVPLGYSQPLSQTAAGYETIDGWLRVTVERETIGAIDEGTGRLLPRFDTERIGFRLGQQIPSVWLQLAPTESSSAQVPERLELPPLDDGPHFGYAMQWFIFATLGIGFYGALLLRQARGHESAVAVEAVDIPA